MKKKRVVKTKAARLAREAARLLRVDYAVAVAREPLDLEITAPIQVRVQMEASYAAQLYDQLRSARKMRRGECLSICIDFPVEILMGTKTQTSLIAVLEQELEEEPRTTSAARGRHVSKAI